MMLGTWPQRTIVLVLLAALGFVIVLLPWRIAARQPIFSLRSGWKSHGGNTDEGREVRVCVQRL
jgi:hypothetical protein